VDSNDVHRVWLQSSSKKERTAKRQDYLQGVEAPCRGD